MKIAPQCTGKSSESQFSSVHLSAQVGEDQWKTTADKGHTEEHNGKLKMTNENQGASRTKHGNLDISPARQHRKSEGQTKDNKGQRTKAKETKEHEPKVKNPEAKSNEQSRAHHGKEMKTAEQQ